MPKPVRELLRLVHVEQIDLSQVKRVDFEIISYLKESHPDLYRSLRRAVRSKHARRRRARHRWHAGGGDRRRPRRRSRSRRHAASGRRPRDLTGERFDYKRRRRRPALCIAAAPGCRRRADASQPANRCRGAAGLAPADFAGVKCGVPASAAAAQHEARTPAAPAMRSTGRPPPRSRCGATTWGPEDGGIATGDRLRSPAHGRCRAGRRQERLARRDDQPARRRRNPRSRRLRHHGLRLSRVPGPQRTRRRASPRGSRRSTSTTSPRSRGPAPKSAAGSSRRRCRRRSDRRHRDRVRRPRGGFARRVVAPSARRRPPRTCPTPRLPVSRKHFLISVAWKTYFMQ